MIRNREMFREYLDRSDYWCNQLTNCLSYNCLPMKIQKYMHDFGITEDTLVKVAVKNYRNRSLNPNKHPVPRFRHRRPPMKWQVWGRKISTLPRFRTPTSRPEGHQPREPKWCTWRRWTPSSPRSSTALSGGSCEGICPMISWNFHNRNRGFAAKR